MGVMYGLLMFDPTDTPCRGIKTHQLSSMTEVESVLRTVLRARPGLNPRMERLMHLVRTHHPTEVVLFEAADDGADLQVQDANGNWTWGPGAEQALFRVAVDPETCDMQALMPDLLFWARELGLDVYDQLQDFFLPWRGKPMPSAEAMAFGQQSGWWRKLRVWNHSIELRQVVIDRLTTLLCPHGWVFAPEPEWDAVYVRDVPSGRQRIQAWIKGPDPGLQCQLHVSLGSRMLTRVMVEAGYPMGNPDGVRKAFSHSMMRFRGRANPGWLRLPLDQVDLAWTEGWLDWMMDDLQRLVLPAMERAKTLQGTADMLLGDTGRVGLPFPADTGGIPETDFMVSALVFAKASGADSADVLAKRYADHCRGKGEEAIAKQIEAVNEVLARYSPERLISLQEA